MVKIIKVPWAAWYGDNQLKMEFPDTWDVQIFNMKDAPPLTMHQIEDSINNPIGTQSLKIIAKDKRTAVIVVEDISRPSKLENILTIMLKELNDAGIEDNRITLLYALGGHRPMNREDSIKKIGLSIMERINIENHHPYENLVYIGDSEKGTPIYINRTYHNAEVKIAIGTVLPHPLAGFGGGAKVILPGICGIQTLEANHQAGVRGIGIGLGIISELRKDIENVCSKVGLDFTVNIITTLNREIAGIFAGHYINAHRKAMEMAIEVYSTVLPPKLNLDIGFFNLYPEDTEFSQALKGLNIFLSSKRFIKRDGAVILMTAATEGRGFHSLQGETGAKLYQNWGDTIIFQALLKKMTFGIYSPNINKYDVLHYYPPNTVFKQEFKELIDYLEEIYGKSPKVGIFPCSNQMPNK